jgi:hypothetical protein
MFRGDELDVGLRLRDVRCGVKTDGFPSRRIRFGHLERPTRGVKPPPSDDKSAHFV